MQEEAADHKHIYPSIPLETATFWVERVSFVAFFTGAKTGFLDRGFYDHICIIWWCITSVLLDSGKPRCKAAN